MVWFKILCLAGMVNEDGAIFLTKDIPYTEDMLATEFGRSIDTVRLSLKVLQQFGMIEIVDNIYQVTNWEKYQNADGLERLREYNRLAKRKERDKKRLLLPGGNDNSMTHQGQFIESQGTDIDIDKEIPYSPSLTKNEDEETETNFPEPTPLQQVAQHYESTVGLLTGTAMHDLQGYLTAGMDAESVCDCIDTVKARNPTPRWSQINRELEQWRINGWMHRIPRDNPAYRLAAEDMTELLGVRKSEPELQEWARTFEAMIQGGTPPAAICEAMEWAIAGHNWWAERKTITSAESLRRNYEKIRAQMEAQNSTA